MFSISACFVTVDVYFLHVDAIISVSRCLLAIADWRRVTPITLQIVIARMDTLILSLTWAGMTSS